jgi:hypothetical protein
LQRKKTVKAAFLELDPEENGFVTIDLVPRLLARLDIGPHSGEDLTRALDPDGMGICLWQNFSDMIEAMQAPKPVAAVRPTTSHACLPSIDAPDTLSTLTRPH